MKASDLLVQCLEEEGIEYIFGVPGEENADFMISLEQSKKIRFILTRHEQGAAFMAEIYGRLTGNPAGALGTLGPGATNLITGVADSNMDRAPMLVLTGQGSTDRLHKESHQIMDVVGMFKPVTKWATSIVNDPYGQWESPQFDADAEIMFLINRELRKRGMSENTAGPDLVIAFAAGIDMDALGLKVDTKTKMDILENVPQGGLVAVLVDSRSGFVIWIGVATAELQESPDTQTVKARLGHAVTQMFNKFPK
jgi:hypothetical protein